MRRRGFGRSRVKFRRYSSRGGFKRRSRSIKLRFSPRGGIRL